MHLAQSNKRWFHCVFQIGESKKDISPAGPKANTDSPQLQIHLHPTQVLKLLMPHTPQHSLAPRLGPALNFHSPFHLYLFPSE